MRAGSGVSLSRALAGALIAAGCGAAHSAAAPVRVPGMSVAQVVADFVPTMSANPWTTPARASWTESYVDGEPTSRGDRAPGVRLVFSVAGCDFADTSIYDVVNRHWVYVIFSGTALSRGGLDTRLQPLCDDQLVRSGYSRVAFILPLDLPSRVTSGTRDVTVTTRRNGVDTTLWRLPLTYRVTTLRRPRSTTIWQGTDAFWNVCVRGDKDVRMRGGRRYCVRTTPGRKRLSVTFAAPRVLGG